jgi:hypothetical protein
MFPLQVLPDPATATLPQVAALIEFLMCPSVRPRPWTTGGPTPPCRFNLAEQLAQIGWIASGSVARRFNRCGKENCACHGDPPRLHGPYWHFTAKVDGKTVNKLLTEPEAHLYEQWIGNDRTVRALLAEMRVLAAKAQALLLAEEAPHPGPDGPNTGSPGTHRRASRRTA